eukprot:SAG11_NODE_8132_length_1057_cov_1.060543_2_plen_74_part_00
MLSVVLGNSAACRYLMPHRQTLASVAPATSVARTVESTTVGVITVIATVAAMTRRGLGLVARSGIESVIDRPC